MSNISAREQQIRAGLAAQNKIVQSLFGEKKKADKFLATAVKVANDYKLAECHPQSIVDACITVAQMNLDLSPVLSHAYIVPFKKTVQLIVSDSGYTAILARNGWKRKSYIVNEEDEFEYIIDGFEEKIMFKKNIDAETQTFKYAVSLALSPDGTLYVEIMNKAQIEKHRKISSNQKGSEPTGVWKDWYDEMALKTVGKKQAKKLPLGEDIREVVEKDDKTIELEGKIVEEPKQDAPVDLNSLSKPQAATTPIPEQQPVEIEVEVPQQKTLTLAQQMKNELVAKGVDEVKAEEWCMTNAEAIPTFLADPASIDVIVEELVGF